MCVGCKSWRWYCFAARAAQAGVRWQGNETWAATSRLARLIHVEDSLLFGHLVLLFLFHILSMHKSTAFKMRVIIFHDSRLIST